MDRLRAMAAGTVPLAPVGSTFGMGLAEVEHGRAIGRIQPLPAPVLQGAGPVLVLGDMALSMAIASTLASDQHITTLTMHVSGLGRPRPGTPLEAVARVEHGGDDFAVATGEVRDGDGTRIALISCRSAMFRARRPVPGSWLDIEPAPDPLAAMGVVTRRDGDAIVAGMPALPGMANAGGGVQGGVLGALAAHAVDVAIATARPHLAEAGTDLELTYLRGVPADGAPASARAELVHAGARFASARAEVRGTDGKLALVVSGSRWRG